MSSVIEKDILALEDRIIKIVFSERKQKDFEFSKISVRPFLSKGKECGSLSSSRARRYFIKI